MNEELRGLLMEVDLGCGPGGWGWDQVVLVRNRGSIPAPPEQPTRVPEDSGFDLLLLGPDFHPRFYCKCRPPADRKLEHETAVLETLSRDPEITGLVPRTRGFASKRIRVQLTDYVSGPLYLGVLPELDAGEWRRTLREVLDVGHRLSACCPPNWLPAGNHDLRAGATGGTKASLAEESAPALAYLVRVGLLAESAEPLAGILRAAGDFVRRPQHGDFWPGNVVYGDAGWCVVDFEEYGRIAVPLYDAFQMIRTSDTIRRDAGPEDLWLDRLRRNDEEARASRQLIQRLAEDEGLDSKQIVGVLVYHLLEVARSFHARRSPPDYWEPVVGDLRLAARFVRSGESLQELVMGPA